MIDKNNIESRGFEFHFVFKKEPAERILPQKKKRYEVLFFCQGVDWYYSIIEIYFDAKLKEKRDERETKVIDGPFRCVNYQYAERLLIEFLQERF